MGGLKSFFKKIGNFFKKLGKQIKTNLKHGAKYIVPVLVSAMTGGFGSGIVQGLFGGNAAGALKGLGGKIFSKLGLKGLTPALTKGEVANVESAVSAATPDVVNSATAALNAAGAPQLAGLGSSTAFGGALNTALSNALPQTVAKLGTSELLNHPLGKLADKLFENNTISASGKSIDSIYAKDNSSSSGSSSSNVELKLPEFGAEEKKSTAKFDPNAAQNGNTSVNNPNSEQDEAMTEDEFRAALAEQTLTPEQIEEMRKKGYRI